MPRGFLSLIWRLRRSIDPGPLPRSGDRAILVRCLGSDLRWWLVESLPEKFKPACWSHGSERCDGGEAAWNLAPYSWPVYWWGPEPSYAIHTTWLRVIRASNPLIFVVDSPRERCLPPRDLFAFLPHTSYLKQPPQVTFPQATPGPGQTDQAGDARTASWRVGQGVDWVSGATQQTTLWWAMEGIPEASSGRRTNWTDKPPRQCKADSNASQIPLTPIGP